MSYQLNNNIATISIDDGKVNAVNMAFIDQLYRHLDTAEREASAVILTGRPGMFSAGFDLKALKASQASADELVHRGMEMLVRMYEFPLPLISACAGHAIGMGAFLLLVSDNRVGSAGDYQVTLPETAIGMPFTPVLMQLLKERVSSQCLTTAALQSVPHSPEQAVDAGFLDAVVEIEQLTPQVEALAEKLMALPKERYSANKRDIRADALRAMKASLAKG